MPVAVCRTTINPATNVSPTCDDVESQNGQFAQFILQEKTGSLSKLSVAIRQARCPSVVNHLAEKSSLGERYGTACQRNPA
jgi:hypothetical protein